MRYSKTVSLTTGPAFTKGGQQLKMHCLMTISSIFHEKSIVENWKIELNFLVVFFFPLDQCVIRTLSLLKFSIHGLLDRKREK